MTSVRSYPALMCSVFCLIGTLIVLFSKAVMGTESLTINHLYILLALIVALGAGHFMWEAFGEGWAGAARGGVMMILLFVPGTIVCVGLSGGRSAAILEQKVHDVEELTKKRAQLLTDVTTADTAVSAAKALYDLRQDAFDAALKKYTQECDDAKGPKCEGKKASLDAVEKERNSYRLRYDDAVAAHATVKAQLDATTVPQDPNPELKPFARLWAMIAQKSFTDAMSDMYLFLPYAFALLAEFGTIAFANHAFTHGPVSSVVMQKRKTIGDIAAELQLEPRIARRMIRSMQIPRPPGGWVWSEIDAAAIKLQLSQATK